MHLVYVLASNRLCRTWKGSIKVGGGAFVRKAEEYTYTLCMSEFGRLKRGHRGIFKQQLVRGHGRAVWAFQKRNIVKKIRFLHLSYTCHQTLQQCTCTYTTIRRQALAVTSR